jgi:hypothetical protein
MAQSGIADNIFSPRDQIANVVAAKESYVALKRGGTTVYMKDKQAFARARHPKRLEFQPTTVTNILFGGSEVQQDFRIFEQNDFETCEWITIRGVLNKTHVAATTCGSYLTEPSPLWINRIEILGNGSTTPLHTIYGDQIWYSMTVLPSEKLAMLMGGNLMYMSTDFKVNNTIQGTETWAHCNNGGTAPTATLGTSYSRPFIIPIMTSLLGNMRLRGLAGDTIFRIYWNPAIFREPAVLAVDAINAASFQEGVLPARTGAVGATAGAALSVWQASNVQLVLESEEVLESDKMQVQRLFENNIVLVKYLEPVIQQFTTQLGGGTGEQAFQLTGIQGELAFLQVYVRDVSNRAACSLRALAPEFTNLLYGGTSLVPVAATNANRALAEVNDAAQGQAVINITDASQKPLFSPNGFQAWDLRYAHHAKSHVNTFHLRHAVYSLNFCENPAKAIMGGEIDGYAIFTAQEYVRLRPTALFSATDLNGATSGTAGTFRVTVVGWRIKHIEVSRRMARII